MSYRNDHDAALARVDALAAENARLNVENEKLRAGETVTLPHAQRSSRRGPLIVASVAGVSAAAIVAVFAASAGPLQPHRLDRFDMPLVDDTPARAHVTKADLENCAGQLELAPSDASAGTTDPRGLAHGVQPVLHSTGCRAEIQDVLATGVVSPKERNALETWADAEARLDATVSMVGEYYASDPYALDGYSTAPQLWTEYNRALVIRNDALEEWRHAAR